MDRDEVDFMYYLDDCDGDVAVRFRGPLPMTLRMAFLEVMFRCELTSRFDQPFLIMKRDQEVSPLRGGSTSGASIGESLHSRP